MSAATLSSASFTSRIASLFGNTTTLAPAPAPARPASATVYPRAGDAKVKWLDSNGARLQLSFAAFARDFSMSVDKHNVPRTGAASVSSHVDYAVKMGSTAHLLLASVGAGVEQLEAYGLLPVDARPDVMAFIQTYVDLLRYAEENPTRASAADREQLLQSICCCINDALQVALRDDLTLRHNAGKVCEVAYVRAQTRLVSLTDTHAAQHANMASMVRREAQSLLPALVRDAVKRELDSLDGGGGGGGGGGDGGSGGGGGDGTSQRKRKRAKRNKGTTGDGSGGGGNNAPPPKGQ